MSTIAECLRDEMVLTEAKRVWAGDPELCLTVYEKSGGKREHPLNRIKSVLDAARKSPLFEHTGYIRACDASGRREIKHPVFALRATENSK